MNLGEIVALAESRLRFGPNTVAHARDIKREAQVKYAALLGAAEWPFLRKTADFPLYAEDEDAATATFTNGSTLVTLTVGSTSATWLGAHVTAPDGLDYEIVRVPLSSTLNLATAYAGSTTTALFDVKWLRYALPKDCGDIAGLLDRDNHRRPIPIRRLAELEMDLRRDQLGDATAVIEEDAVQEYAPLDTLTVVVGSGGANSLAATTTYRYRYTFEIGGRESPPSSIASGTTTAGNKTITLTLEATAANSGRRKRVYRDSGSGAFQYLATVAEATTTYADDGAVAVSRTERLEDYHTALRRYLRFYSRPTTAVTLELQYHRKPPALVAESDVPLLPVQYHEVLANMVIAEFRKRENMDVTALRVEIREGLSRMAREYFRDSYQPSVKRAWSPRSGFPGATHAVSVSGGFASLLP